ncbi:ribosome-associated translation inhibitor RaiA [Candidatus Parcubacteria bacterium]|jgi:putative sigma-54 modulation protein|nr:ribosome-associated translation inhibitor RaiA [Candidatus Parcubacteria bacterium]MBT7228256.1 ribosome-associated translation inhibitor RaiA [Candidatus Parcubacteria bacterium]
MNIKIYNKKFDLTPAFKKYLKEKLQGLKKYKNDIESVNIELARDQHHKKGEVFTVGLNITMPNKHTIQVSETNSDAYAAVDIVQDIVARQLVKYKEKNISKQRKKRRYFKSLKFWKRSED